MTARDAVMIALGEILLALTFGLGILVGCSMRTKGGPRNGYSDSE